MRLTQWTDYTLRVLMYCAAAQDRLTAVTITEVADAYDISRSHLTKIVQQLGATGLLETTRGRGGGIRLRRAPTDINLGAVVRATETDFHLVECFDPSTNQCRLTPSCGLKGILAQAMHSFMQVLDAYTLADLMTVQASPGGPEQLVVLTPMVAGKLHTLQAKQATPLPTPNAAAPAGTGRGQQSKHAQKRAPAERVAPLDEAQSVNEASPSSGWRRKTQLASR